MGKDTRQAQQLRLKTRPSASHWGEFGSLANIFAFWYSFRTQTHSVKRRNALKMVAASVGGIMTLPVWANHWTPESIRATGSPASFLSMMEVDLLAEITETIIPTTQSPAPAKTEIPGAKAVQVHRFVERMVVDCSDKAAQETFRKGLSATDDVAQAYINKPFLEGTPAERLTILKQMSQSSDATQKGFVALVKNLTIRGYMTSEYVMTNISHFEMAPARYKGCVKA
jgi:hypothetical protein